MRMPELKSLARDRGLRNYSRMRKAELVAFLTIWVRIILRCVGAKPPSGAKGPTVPAPALASKVSLSPHPATFSPMSVYLGPVYKLGRNKVTKYPSIKISYTGNYLFL